MGGNEAVAGAPVLGATMTTARAIEKGARAVVDIDPAIDRPKDIGKASTDATVAAAMTAAPATRHLVRRPRPRHPRGATTGEDTLQKNDTARNERRRTRNTKRRRIRKSTSPKRRRVVAEVEVDRHPILHREKSKCQVRHRERTNWHQRLPVCSMRIRPWRRSTGLVFPSFSYNWVVVQSTNCRKCLMHVSRDYYIMYSRRCKFTEWSRWVAMGLGDGATPCLRGAGGEEAVEETSWHCCVCRAHC
mmetsp:Transcript_30201/g.63686  ORF Transcript_30201/g.63686 Transcript_30201/m.63686 type:complete len:246 (-) Transcript_30201:1668-2405(-)